jgi:DNA-directed RNA polymerase subunit RPC12/RpoP
MTRERVRQLLNEMGIKTAFSHLRQRRRRKPTLAELKKINILYQKGVATLRISKELNLHPSWLRTIMAQHEILGRFRCARCGREFRRTGTVSRYKYCEACSVQLTLERASEYNRRRYKTDPEYRKRKLMSNDNWRHSEAGKKWHAEYLEKMRQRSVK